MIFKQLRYIGTLKYTYIGIIGIKSMYLVNDEVKLKVYCSTTELAS
jgi:hypothetical protein